MTAFTKEQWKIRSAAERTMYAFVDNTVSIAPLRGREKTRWVVVPSELFVVLDSLLSAADKAMAQAHTLAFYLDEYDPGRWVFGLYCPETDFMLDLWDYSTTKLPAWADFALNSKN